MTVGLLDIGIGFIILITILTIGYFIKSRKEAKDHTYKNFFIGLIIKLLGTIGFCLIYIYYFEGGDTFDYHQNGEALVNLFFKDINAWYKVMISSKEEYYYFFDAETGYPNLRHFLDSETFNVSRILFFFELISFKSFIGSSLLISAVSYMGLFKLYQSFSKATGDRRNYLFYVTVCVPSVIFWSGGMLKDTITLYSSLMAVVFVNKLLHGKIRLSPLFGLLINLFLIIEIKPYLIVAMIPAIMIWVMWRNIMLVKSVFLKIISIPIIITAFTVLAFLVWNTLSGSLGEYSSVEGMIEKAVITQEDLQNQRYDGNSFDIGAFEPTVAGALGKFPQATTAGLYRPFIFEANNVVMFLSGLENTVLLLLTIVLLFRMKSLGQLLRTHPIFIYAVVFIIIFSFAIGLSTSNFGALVRFKIPMFPLLFPLLFIVYYKLPSFDKKKADGLKN